MNSVEIRDFLIPRYETLIALLIPCYIRSSHHRPSVPKARPLPRSGRRPDGCDAELRVRGAASRGGRGGAGGGGYPAAAPRLHGDHGAGE